MPIFTRRRLAEVLAMPGVHRAVTGEHHDPRRGLYDLAGAAYRQ